MARVLVIGGGVAGLVTAIRASERHDVVLITKGALAESNTRYAQGGIAGALGPGDTVDAHIADTAAAGAGLCDTAAVAALCEAAPARLRDLIDWGVAFDRNPAGELSYGREAAHSAARILHAGGDSTGAFLQAALMNRLHTTSIQVAEHTFLVDLIHDEGRCSGAIVLGPDGVRRDLVADAIVLATGGAGQLFQHTTNPTIATGDGLAAALRAGAMVADLEFYQFHPTAMARTGFLISEAVRGEGAVLRNARGERFLQREHPDAELAPRDVVARGIGRAMADQDGEPVGLDATALGAGFLERRFPSIDAAVRAAGFDWSREWVPVTPAAHYAMGGVATDGHGRTSIRDLFAVGEVARTGVHGANRLASNSLLEGAVFGARAADAIGSAWPVAVQPEPVARDALVDADVPREELQRLMWEHAGLVRNSSGLQAVLDWVRDAESTADRPWDVGRHEDRNLLHVAQAVVAAAAARHESRGAHWRTDFPHTDTSLAAPQLARHTVSAPASRLTEAIAC